MEMTTTTSPAAAVPPAGLGGWMDQVLTAHAGVDPDCSATAVWVLRNSLRISSSLIEALMEVTPGSLWQDLRRTQGERLFGILGELSDLSAMLSCIAHLSPRRDRLGRAVAARLAERRRELVPLAREALAAFDQATWQRYARELPELAAQLPREVFTRLAAERLAAVADLDRRAAASDAIGAISAIDDLHELRLGIKRLRGLAEALLPAEWALWGDDLKRLQTALGDVRNLHLLAEVLARHAQETSADEAALAGWRERVRRASAGRLAEYHRIAGQGALWQRWSERLPSPSAHPSAAAGAAAPVVDTFFHHPAVRPYGGAPHVVNAFLEQGLRGHGYTVRSHSPDPGDDPLASRFIDLPGFRRLAELEAGDSDLGLYCDGGVLIRPPSRRRARRNAVFFHGVARGGAVWTANPDVDLCIANSPYLARVLRAVFALPDWRRRRCLDPRAFGLVTHLTLALPCTEEPDGDPEVGAGRPAELPARVRAALDAGDLVGHAVQNFKGDAPARVEILLALVRQARAAGDRRKVRLVISERDLPWFAEPAAGPARAALAAHGLTVEDLFLPVPPLPQRLLFQLFAACSFGLSYNVYPETFGFYVLESVFNHCPVYTNGVGNMRFALPVDHGLQVIESEAMALGLPGAYDEVAARIRTDAGSGREAARRRCAAGRAVILERYNRAALERDLTAILARLAGSAAVPESEFAGLTVAVGPLVRHWNRQSGVVISDRPLPPLPAADNALALALLGRPCGEIAGELTGERLAAADRLFTAGVLALEPPA